MAISKRSCKASASIIILLFLAGLLIGGMGIFLISYRHLNNLNTQVRSLQDQVSAMQGIQNATYQTINIFQNETALVEIYETVRASVVLVQGVGNTGRVQGSGFVYSFEDRLVIITNYHVIQDTTGLSVTFSNGNGFPATILGTDPYSDLAVLSVDAPVAEFKPIEIVSSSTLRVGEPVIAIGNPYGLVGSLTTGVVSALGRTIMADTVGGFAIANIIQTSAPINPGNSGGPMLNAVGKVVGVTTAIVSESQGLGFAVPSNTILRVISALINTGSYQGHSYLGVSGQDMSYNLAQEIGASVTFGWRIASVVRGGPSDGLLNVGDIVIALNQQIIRNNDDLASFLAEQTLPGDNLVVTVVRGDRQQDITLVLGTRPTPR